MNRAQDVRGFAIRLAAGVFVCLFLCALAVAPEIRAAGPPALPFGVNLQDQPLHGLAPAGTQEVVLFFAATDCPISNRYVPEIARLSELYRGQHVEVLSVYPNPGDTQTLVAAHQRDFGAAGETVRDPQQALVHLAHALMTPEAAVLVPESAGWREVYLGRIDDRYLSLGEERPAATRHDLEEAIQAVLDHHPVPPPGGPAVGCGIIPVQ